MINYHYHECIECGDTSPACDGLISECGLPKRMICWPCKDSLIRDESEALGEE